MSKYLLTATEVYRVDTENEVEELIQNAKDSYEFELKKYNREYKTKKQGGEIVDEYYKVSLVKVFNDEKDPVTPVSYISYSSLKDEEEDIE